jgi:outer membrane receptor for ferrienterochelin and colicins
MTHAARRLLRCVFIALAAFACSTGAARAQALVRGRVLSKSDGSPVVAAEVVRADGRARTRTDEQGRFQLSSARGDSLHVHALGFHDLRLVIVNDSIVVALEAFATALPAVTTTAGQRTIRVNESTASVAVVDRTGIDAVAAVSVSQLLRQLPGLQEIPSPPSKSTIAIRGLDAARVLVLVDGEPVAGALIDTRDIGRLSTVAAERIEVTKGPSSVEFGSDALGGVINLVTSPPSATFKADATARVGGMGRRESSIDVTDTRGALGYRVSAGWRQMDGLFAVDAQGTTLDRVYDVRADTRYRVSARLSLRGDVQLSQERQRWPVGAGYNGFIDNHGAQALTEARLTAFGGVVRARVFAQYSDYQYRQSQQMVPIAGSADSLEQQEHLGRLLVSYTRAAGSHILDVGSNVSARAIVAPTKIDGDRANDRLVEFFARDAWTRGPVLLTLGGRSTSSSLWGSALTPSVGAAWQIADAWRTRASVARGFRAPSFKEIRYTFTNPIASYVIEGNPDLDPESSWNTDLGVTWAPHRAAVFELDGYRTRVNNLIDTRLTGINADGFQVYRNVNVTRAGIEGVELSARFALARGDASFGYNYLRARDLDSGRQLDRRASHTARVQIAQRWSALAGLTSDLSIHYTGSALLGNATQGALLAVDGQVRLGVAPRVELSIGVNNLFDARPALWTPASRRQVFMGLRARAGTLD